MAKFNALPIYFADGEKASEARSNFKLGKIEENGSTKTKWESNDANVVVISGDSAYVTGVGKVTLTVTYEGNTRSFEITVIGPKGEGTEDIPYEIANLKDLRWLSESDEGKSLWDGEGLYFVQTADIDASATKDWNDKAGISPIGVWTKSLLVITMARDMLLKI